ncbi:MAG: hypothetical protein E6F97_00895 [Actinobacteria bacterium]|nr:MAG: hypothetical protein E6F97_00895 [Actinomycetota bacterium]
MNALVIGCGRVGSSIALQLVDEGWDVTAVDEKEEAFGRLGDHWNGRFVLGHGMDIEVLREAGIEDADAVVVATDGDNTNIVIGQVAQHRFDNQCVVVRVLDPARADFYRRRVGANFARVLLQDQRHELTLIEQRRDRFERLEHEFEHQVQLGDATEIYVLERAGIARPPDVVAALTGDDEDNIIICQLAGEKYGVQKVIARVNDPRNQAHFDLLGISPTVSATRGLMALIEHEVPEHDLVHLLELRKENLEIVEVMIDAGAPGAGKRVEDLDLPEGSRLISITRNGHSEIAVGATELQPGDQVLAILQPGKEDELRRVLLKA